MATAIDLPNPNQRLLRFLSATPEQQAAIDQFLSGGQLSLDTTALRAGAVPAPAATAETFITKVEVAKRLNRDVRTITTWMRQGLIPYYRIAHTVAFKWSEVEKQLAATCRVARPRF